MRPHYGHSLTILLLARAWLITPSAWRAASLAALLRSVSPPHACIAGWRVLAREQGMPGPPYAALAGGGCVPVSGLDTRDRWPCVVDDLHALARSVLLASQDRRFCGNTAPSPLPVLLRAVLDWHSAAVGNGRVVASLVRETSDRPSVARGRQRCEPLGPRGPQVFYVATRVVALPLAP